MLPRVIVALIGIPLVLLALLMPGGELFIGLLTLLGIVAVLEMGAALEKFGRPINALLPMMGVGFLIASYAHPVGNSWRLPGLVGLFLIALVCEAFKPNPRPAEGLGRLLLMTIYPGLFAVAAALRLEPGTVQLSGIPPLQTGSFWVLTAFLFVWATDTAAYFTGRQWGRRELAPILSPSKTWEGAVGGWLGATLIGGLMALWAGSLLFPFGLWSGCLLGGVAGIWGQVGDLCESSLKRELGVKDFGGWLPGHGGILDRFDSFLFVCPLVYLFSHLMGSGV